MGNEHDILKEDFAPATANILPQVMEHETTLREYSLAILNLYLQKYQHNVPLVARKLAISQATIYRMIKEIKSV